jgi:hypothetical protein
MAEAREQPDAFAAWTTHGEDDSIEFEPEDLASQPPLQALEVIYDDPTVR